MPAALSVVIATLDEEAALARSAAALFEGVQAGLLRELIVSDGGSKDGTLDLAEEIGAEVVRAAPGAQLQAGAEAARGEWLLLLSAGTQPARGWSDAVLAQMQAGRAGVFRHVPAGRGPAARLGALWVNLQSRLLGRVAPGQVLLVRARDFGRVKPVLMGVSART